MVLGILAITAVFSAVLGHETEGKDSVVVDTVVRSNFQDPAAYRDLPEKPLWFFIDSLEQISLRPIEKAPAKPKYQVSTRETLIGLLAGFEVSRVEYTITFQEYQPVPEVRGGTLLLMHIWPGLYKLIAAYSGGDAPDSSQMVYLGELECMGNFWFEESRNDVDWAQYWTWDWPTEAPKNLRFMPVTASALDSILPPGYYARYSGLLDYETLCLTAPVYKPTDDFGKPTGGEARVCYRLEDNLLVVTECAYFDPE